MPKQKNYFLKVPRVAKCVKNNFFKILLILSELKIKFYTNLIKLVKLIQLKNKNFLLVVLNSIEGSENSVNWSKLLVSK